MSGHRCVALLTESCPWLLTLSLLLGSLWDYLHETHWDVGVGLDALEALGGEINMCPSPAHKLTKHRADVLLPDVVLPHHRRGLARPRLSTGRSQPGGWARVPFAGS